MRDVTISDFKQLQIDMFFVRTHFQKFGVGSNVDYGLIIEECLHSAAARCSDPKVMEVSSILF